jgi:hypothetical protein
VAVSEVVVIFALLTAVVAVAAPAVGSLEAAVSGRSAAAEVSAALFRARAYAISSGRYVGLKFQKNGDRCEWALYRDGNGNGIRTSEIASGVDRSLGVSYAWSRNDVRPGILTGNPVPDPGRPGHFLDRLDDPIRFGNSDICSFSPIGESSPGSVYLWDGRDRMAVVRVFDRTAKIRALYYRRGQKEWTP